MYDIINFWGNFFFLPNGRSRVLEGVRITGNDVRCRDPRRKPVDDVSASDMIPGSSSSSTELLGDNLGPIHRDGDDDDISDVYPAYGFDCQLALLHKNKELS